MDTVLGAVIIVWLPSIPACVVGICVSVLPYKGALIRQVGEAYPVELAVGQEAVQGCLIS